MPKVTIYTRAFCPYCSRALALLKEKKVAMKVLDIRSMRAPRNST